MRSRGIYLMVAAAIAGVCLSGIPVFANGSSEQPGSLPTSIHGVVEYVEGTVTVNGKPADFGQSIAQGDRVETGANSQVQIVFNQKNIFQLQQNTIAVIDMGEAVKRIELKTGTFAAVFSDLAVLAGTRRVDVQTPTVVGSVRGTSFFVRVLDPTDTYICICQGVVQENDPSGGNAARVAAEHHTAYTYSGSGADISVKSAAMLYHNDADMDALAKRVGYTIPWNQPPQDHATP